MTSGRQFQRLHAHLRPDCALRRNTIVLICSNNGPHFDEGSAAQFKGFKTQVYMGARVFAGGHDV